MPVRDLQHTTDHFYSTTLITVTLFANATTVNTTTFLFTVAATFQAQLKLLTHCHSTFLLRGITFINKVC